MTILAAIAFATLFLEYNHLVTFHEGCSHLANNFCTLYSGRADLDGTVGVNEQNAVEFHGLAFLDFFAEVVYIQEAVLFCLELLALNLYDNVHYNC